MARIPSFKAPIVGARTLAGRRRARRLKAQGPQKFNPWIAGEGEVWFDGGLVLGGDTHVVGRHEWNGDSRVVFAFDITPCLGATVSRATLRLPIHDIAPHVFSSVAVFLDHVDGGGLIDASDYAGNTLNAGKKALPAGNEFAIDVTDRVQDDLANGRPISTFRLRLEVRSAEVDFWTIAMGASSHARRAKQPTLEYEA